MKNTLLLSLLMTVLIITGCSTAKPIYDYGNYSEKYYAFKKNPDAKSTENFKSALESIIENSTAKGMRVPPGIYANLGYLYLTVNNSKKAISLFEEEKKIYPESSILMDNLIKKAKSIENGSNS